MRGISTGSRIKPVNNILETIKSVLIVIFSLIFLGIIFYVIRRKFQRNEAERQDKQVIPSNSTLIPLDLDYELEVLIGKNCPFVQAKF